MEKLPMCRICLAENIRMYVVVNKNLHELYERLTDIPFVTDDSRPILACSFCCTKLKQCFQLLRKCLEAEEQFAQIMNGNYEPKPLINQDHLKVAHGFIISIDSISIVEVGQTDSVVVEEELPAVCERQDNILEPKEEYQCDDLELENLDSTRLCEEDIRAHGSKFDSEDDVPLMDFKLVQEEEPKAPQEICRTLDPKNIKQKNRDISYSDKDISFPSIKFEEDSEDDVPLVEFKTKVGEEQEVSEQKQRAMETNRSTVAEEPALHLRRTKLEDSILADLKTNQKADSKIIRATQNRTFKNVTKFKKLYECEICHYKCSSKTEMTKHVRTHTGDKPYKCNICQSSFSQIGNLTKHIRTHTGEKPYKCDICQSSFSLKDTLTRHTYTHW